MRHAYDFTVKFFMLKTAVRRARDRYAAQLRAAVLKCSTTHANAGISGKLLTPRANYLTIIKSLVVGNGLPAHAL